MPLTAASAVHVFSVLDSRVSLYWPSVHRTAAKSAGHPFPSSSSRLCKQEDRHALDALGSSPLTDWQQALCRRYVSGTSPPAASIMVGRMSQYCAIASVLNFALIGFRPLHHTGRADTPIIGRPLYPQACQRRFHLKQSDRILIQALCSLSSRNCLANLIIKEPDLG